MDLGVNLQKEVYTNEHTPTTSGSPGIRDRGLIDLELARPQNLYAYSEDVTLPQLAASYAVSIIKNHGFIGGNKRTAWVVCAVFLEINGIPVEADQATVVAMVLGIASGELTEGQFARWLEDQQFSSDSNLKTKRP